MIEIFSGKTGQGKSLSLADKVMTLLARNEKWFKKSGQQRKILSNLKYAPWVEELYPGRIVYWKDVEEVAAAKEVDVIWDEIANQLDANDWSNLPSSVKTFLRQHEKRGVNIYGTTQHFAMIDVSMRRLVDNLYVCKKLLGSRRPSATKPPVKRVWGVVWLTQLDPMTIEDDKPKSMGVPDWLIITRKLVDVYDTRQEIEKGKYPPLKHIERDCSDPNCSFHRIIHA